MKQGKEKSTSLILLISLFVTILIAAFGGIYFFLSKPGRDAENRLPIYQPSDVNTSLVDSTVQYIRKYHTIANFKLVNQNGDTITQKNYEGKIYVADFFFTTCPGICPIMTANMADIQKEILNNDKVLLLSHSVTPVQDSVPQLKKYAIKKGVIDSKWNLVTGDKKQIYNLARKSYLAAESDGDGGPYDMVHTENFVLVDTKRRIRGFYDGTKKEEIKRLLEDIKKLEKE
ncbi:SCO family protein [Neptunitalea chrysea]|uniref:SCO family protein n=1 Tax=Neptunitalea chrysea TaxID=1647581 RepID=A0A9W6ETP4_9FLAO|nr:SCO family protein [Neptunitalea chrysea]GLB51394.1 SCO family protein [Neptunitalea chrysea]